MRATTSTSRIPWWLALSAPLAVLATTASVVGIAVDDIYAAETADWRTQAVGQDVANLLVLPVLLALAWAAARGSVPALLGWLGTVVYAAYTYAIYVFDVHFGPLFLVHVGIFGLAVWSLVGALGAVDPDEARVATGRGPHRFAAGLLVGTAVAFALLWLAEDVPASVAGEPSATLLEVGLPTNPVHVLDLSLLLPAALLAGILLRRDHAWGHVLAPVVLVAMAAISVGIVALSVLAAVRDEGGSLVVAAVVGPLGVVQARTAARLLVTGSRPRARRATGLPSTGSRPTPGRRRSAP